MYLPMPKTESCLDLSSKSYTEDDCVVQILAVSLEILSKFFLQHTAVVCRLVCHEVFLMHVTGRTNYLKELDL